MNTYQKFYSNQLNNTLNRIKTEFKGKEKDKVVEYYQYLKKERVSDARIINILQKIIKLSKLLNKSFLDVTTKDAEELIERIDKLDWKERSKGDLKALYKQYRKWLTGNIDFPDDVRWIRKRILLDSKKIEEVTPDSILKTDDYKTFINACDNPRDKAMFGIIGELGLRPKESLMLKIKNVDLSNPQYALITVPSDTKTGSRTIPCIFAKKWLQEWVLKFHPYKDDKEAWLFSQQQRNKELSIGYKGLADRFEQIKSRTNLSKKYPKFTLYLFRKFSYTFKATKGWSDQQIKAFHGLNPKSKAIDVYVKIDPKDLVNNMMEMYGLKVKREKGKSLSVIKCPNCEAENPDSNKQCDECGLLFDIGEANKRINEIKEKDKEMEDMKEMMKKFQENYNELVANGLIKGAHDKLIGKVKQKKKA